MKKTLSISILSLFLVATFCLTLAWAQEETEKPIKKIRERRIEKVVEKLELTDQQKEELSKLRLENQKEMIKLRAELQTLQLDLKALLEPREPDKAKVNALIDKISTLRNEMMKKRIDFSLKKRAIFTDEQWEKMRKRKGAFRFGRMGRKFRRGRHFFHRLRGQRFIEKRLKVIKEKEDN